MLFIVRIHLNLIISRESIRERYSFEPAPVVDHDIRDWKGKLIYRTHLICIIKINTNPDLPILHGKGDDIGYPIRVLFFPDKTRVYKLLDFQLNCFHYLRAEPSLMLLDELRIRIDVEVMHSHLRVEPRHILVVPSENIYILSHKRYYIFLLEGGKLSLIMIGLSISLISQINLGYLILCGWFALFKANIPESI